MDDLRPGVANDAGELPRGGEIDLAARRQRHQIRTLASAPIELALRMRNQHLAMVERPQPEHRQEDLVLSAAPGARGVDVEGEHSSQSFANLRPT